MTNLKGFERQKPGTYFIGENLAQQGKQIMFPLFPSDQHLGSRQCPQLLRPPIRATAGEAEIRAKMSGEAAEEISRVYSEFVRGMAEKFLSEEIAIGSKTRQVAFNKWYMAEIEKHERTIDLDKIAIAIEGACIRQLSSFDIAMRCGIGFHVKFNDSSGKIHRFDLEGGRTATTLEEAHSLVYHVLAYKALEEIKTSKEAPSQEKIEEWLACAQIALHFNPKNPDLHNMAANAWHMLSVPRKRIEHLQAAAELEKTPKARAVALLNLADEFSRDSNDLESMKKSIVVYGEAINAMLALEKPDNVGLSFAYYGRAMAKYDTAESIQEVLSDCEKAFKCNPEFREALDFAIELCETLGYREKAESYLRMKGKGA